MASAHVTLKVHQHVPGTVVSKSLDYPGDLQLEGVCQDIRNRLKASYPNLNFGDFALFYGAQSMWLDVQKTLDFYDIKTGEAVEFKNKFRPMKILFPNETIKTLLLDESLSVNLLVQSICEHISLSNPEELSLVADFDDDLTKRLTPTTRRKQTTGKRGALQQCPEDDFGEMEGDRKMKGDATLSKAQYTKLQERLNEPQRKALLNRQASAGSLPTASGLTNLRVNEPWLDPNKSLVEQGLRENDVVLLKYRFFCKLNLSRKDHVRLDMLFWHARSTYLAGECILTPRSTAKFIALLLQFMFGDYDPKKHTVNFFTQSKHTLCPKRLRIKPILNRIIAEYEQLRRMEDLDIKYCFVRLWTQLDSFGLELFTCLAKHTGQKGLFAVGHNRIIFVTVADELPAIFYLEELRKWMVDTLTDTITIVFTTRQLKLTFPDLTRVVCDCLQGNVEIITLHRAIDEAAGPTTHEKYEEELWDSTAQFETTEQVKEYSSQMRRDVPRDFQKMAFKSVQNQLYWEDRINVENPLWDGEEWDIEGGAKDASDE
jgi:talin